MAWSTASAISTKVVENRLRDRANELLVNETVDTVQPAGDPHPTIAIVPTALPFPAAVPLADLVLNPLRQISRKQNQNRSSGLMRFLILGK